MFDTYCDINAPASATLRIDDGTDIIGVGLFHVEFLHIDGRLEHWGGWLSVEADGFVTQTIRVSVEAPQLLREDGTPLQVTLEPSWIALPRLVADGMFLRLETGERFTAIDCTDFHLLGLLYEQGPDAVEAIFEDRVGFNCHRIFTDYDLSAYGIGTCLLRDHSDLYDRLNDLAHLAAKHGRYLNAVACGTGGSDSVEHWQHVGEVGQANTSLALVSLVNEYDQDANRRAIAANPAFQPIPGVLCSHGSAGSQVRPPEPWWDWTELHTNDAFEWWRKSHNAMELVDPATGGHGFPPCHVSEQTRCPDRDATEAHFEDNARAAALLCMGACFHSVSGKRSALFDDTERRCAAAHVRGTSSLDLVCQSGPYRRLDPGPYLRVYERPVDGHSCVVEIRP